MLGIAQTICGRGGGVVSAAIQVGQVTRWWIVSGVALVRLVNRDNSHTCHPHQQNTCRSKPFPELMVAQVPIPSTVPIVIA